MPVQPKQFDRTFRAERNRRIIECAAEGRSSKWIAATFGLSIDVVNRIISRVSRGQGWGNEDQPEAAWEVAVQQGDTRTALADMPHDKAYDAWVDALEDAEDGYYGPCVYFLHVAGTRTIKIGTTHSSRIRARIRELQNANPNELIPRRVVKGDENVEVMLHVAFAERRIRNEWFDCDERLAEIARVPL